MNLRQVLVLQAKLIRLRTVEQRIGGWVMGWTLIMGGAFIGKFLAPIYVGWEVVASLAAVHEILLVALYAVNGRRHLLAERLAYAEASANSGAVP